MKVVLSTVLCTPGAWVFQSHLPEPSSHGSPVSLCPLPGAALGPLLAGLLSPSGWNNVFYMLMFADACALLVSLSDC